MAIVATAQDSRVGSYIPLGYGVGTGGAGGAGMYVGGLEEVDCLTLRGNMPPEIFAASSSVSSSDFAGIFPRSIVFFSSDTGHLRKERLTCMTR
jgi:hypothetical protein